MWVSPTMIINSGWLSLILFALFTDDLFDEDSECNAGVKAAGDQLRMLLYADNIVISPSVGMAQQQLDVLTTLCAKWRMKMNVKKSQVMHIRNYQKPRAKTLLSCCGQELSYSETYKYLSYIMQENMSEKTQLKHRFHKTNMRASQLALYMSQIASRHPRA